MAGGRLSPARAIVVARKGQVTANSRDVAELFGKRHDNVLRSLDSFDCSARFTALDFEVSTYTDTTGRKLRSFSMTKDGFVFLVMGFTGKQAAQFKEVYIERFNAMEAELRHRSSRSQRAPPRTDSSLLGRPRTALSSAWGYALLLDLHGVPRASSWEPEGFSG